MIKKLPKKEVRAIMEQGLIENSKQVGICSHGLVYSRYNENRSFNYFCCSGGEQPMGNQTDFYRV